MAHRWRRNKLDTATEIARAFEATQRAMWSSIWPHGHCMVTSLLLAPLIRVPLEWDVAVTVGVAHENRPHAWIETPCKDIIDPTFGQFTGEEALVVLPADRSTQLGHCAKVRLNLKAEEVYRNAIRPSVGNGWCESVDIATLFGPNAHLSPAVRAVC